MGFSAYSESCSARRFAQPAVEHLDDERKKIYKDAYLRNTKQALKRGVFGSPFYFFEGDCFWGQDQLGFLEELLSNQVYTNGLNY